MSRPADRAEHPTPATPATPTSPKSSTSEAPAPQVESQIEPHDELLRFAANADELAQRIWNGQGTDLNHLIGDAIQSRETLRAA